MWPLPRCTPTQEHHKITRKSWNSVNELWNHEKSQRNSNENATRTRKTVKKMNRTRRKTCKIWKNGRNKGESEKVAEWVVIFSKKTQNMQSDYILSCINISKSTRKALITLGFWKKQKLLLFIREGTIWRKCPRYARSALSAAGALVWIKRNLR